ncbi:MAG: hypothetical protein AAF558_00930 [Verrucomicrobiota bacterium]
MTFKRFSLTKRLIFLSVALILFSVGLACFFVYIENKKSLELSLSNELKAIVNSVAPLIDGDLHEFIRKVEGIPIEEEEDFRVIQDTLTKIKTSNNLFVGDESPLYTLRKAEDFAKTQELEFVVMTDRNEHGGILYWEPLSNPRAPHYCLFWANFSYRNL